MPATYQFLRFVIPGLVFVIELAIFLAVGRAGLGWTEWLWRQTKERDLSDAISAFILSGGIGYLVSTVYHLLLYRCFGPNFSEVAEEISKLDTPPHREGLMPGGVSEPFSHGRKVISRVESWLVVTAFWHSRRGMWPTLEGATQRAESLADLMHGAGSSLAASLVAAFISGMSILSQLGLGVWHTPNIIAAGIAASVLIAMHGWSFGITAQNTKRFVSQVLRRAIEVHA